ncbi:PepSY-associated TM helix domain-containing protein, partial [Pantoea deleyi]
AAYIYAVRPAPGPQDTTRVQFSGPELGPSESRSLFIDPYTLQVKGDMTVYGTSGVLPLRMWLDQLHRGLLLGDFGRNYSELAASWLWVAALGGLVLWAGTRPRKRTKARRGFAAIRHWHVTLGLLLAVGLVFFSVTGLTWSQWAGNNIEKMRSDFGWKTPQVNTALNGEAPAEAADPHADHRGTMTGMNMSDMTMPAKTVAPVVQNQPDARWDRVLVAAREAGLDAAKLELRQPKKQDQAWTVSEIDRRWPSQVDAVSINPTDFSVVDRVAFAHFPLVAKLTRWGVDAHMGVLFGLANQLILAFFGFGLCAMIVLGYRMWWIRRPAVPQL